MKHLNPCSAPSQNTRSVMLELPVPLYEQLDELLGLPHHRIKDKEQAMARCLSKKLECWLMTIYKSQLQDQLDQSAQRRIFKNKE